jgi:hypothetical protein
MIRSRSISNLLVPNPTSPGGANQLGSSPRPTIYTPITQITSEGCKKIRRMHHYQIATWLDATLSALLADGAQEVRFERGAADRMLRD